MACYRPWSFASSLRQNHSRPFLFFVFLLSAGLARYPQRTLTGYWEKILSGETSVEPVNLA